MIMCKRARVFFNRILMLLNAFKCSFIGSFIFVAGFNIVDFIVTFIEIFYWIHHGHK